ncbi:MAG: hypothetical protein PHD81_03785 [Candidatus Nanoarchaeia archaeon]|nr:hypothetical protein [Candidatus Nanoarchaeia archaeon]MDD5588203.1 hypothetical protein [Candidatus Nanoarchaeia archaeon]
MGLVFTENLELIKSKRDALIGKVIEKHPELKDKKDFYLYFDIQKLLNDPSCNVENEFIVWDELLREYYWRSYSAAKNLIKSKENPLSQKDLELAVTVMAEQILEGKQIAGGIVKYSDMWKILESKKELAKFVSEDKKREAVNIGFWDMLKKSGEIKGSAPKELVNIMFYENFFSYFDFKSGVKEAEKLDNDIDLTGLDIGEFDMYVRWYLVQESFIYRKLACEEEKREEAHETCGKLLAPILDRVLGSSEDAQEEDYSKLMGYFVNDNKGIINSKAIQKVLGENFEREFKNGLEYGEDYFSERVFKTCKDCLINIEPHINKAWEEFEENEEVDLSQVSPLVKDYIPKEAYEEYVTSLKEKILIMKRFDLKLFKNWMDLRVGKDVPDSVHGKIRNEMYSIYFSQGARPSGDDLVGMLNYSDKGSNYSQDKLKGFLFADLLIRKRWDKANEILFSYDPPITIGSHPVKPLKIFFEALSEYVKLHGKIKMDVSGLKPRACYPIYNKLIDFKENNPNLFK